MLFLETNLNVGQSLFPGSVTAVLRSSRIETFGYPLQY